MFNDWFLRVSGVGLLFTSVAGKASPFAVGRAGELCAMGVVDGQGVPYVAVVELQNNNSNKGGSVWLMGRGMLEVRGEDYAPLKCDQGDEGLRCGEGDRARSWLGCGMQLDLAGTGGDPGPERGLNCTDVALEVLE
jgi:hypothetical protein